MAQRCSDIDEFSEKVKELYALDPRRVRFVMKRRAARRQTAGHASTALPRRASRKAVTV
jgi:hypothetical protein